MAHQRVQPDGAHVGREVVGERPQGSHRDLQGGISGCPPTGAVWDTRRVLRFEGFELDEARRELRGPDGVVHLEPQAFDVLVLLADQRHRVVAKHELLDGVWGHRHVSESALTTRIKEVRRALGDDGSRQAFVANVRSRGYRFVAAVDDDAAGSADDPVAAGARAVQVDDPTVLGRDADLAAVLDGLSAGRLVTVVGPGGVGKTTLARQVVRAWTAGEQRSVAWVALAGVDGPEGVVPAVAEALGVMADHGDPRHLADAVAARAELVVLDDCERLVEAVAELARMVLDRSGGLRLLATSRERLGCRGEAVRTLRPLHAAEARRLLVDRAAAAGAVVDAEDASVAGIADAVEGLPLALEMAAAQLATMSVSEVEGLVRHRLDLLRAPDRAAPSRHRTLGAVVQWSLDLLDAPRRALLDDATALAGPVDPADLAAVLADDDGPGGRAAELALGLGELAERSLVAVERSGPATRFEVPSVVRSVVGPEPERAAELARRHARHFVAVAREADAGLRTPDERAAHDRLTRAVPELRAAHRWAAVHEPATVADLAAALHHFAYSRLWGEPVEWARAVGDPSDPVVAALLAADAANRSRLAEADDLARRALASGEPRAVVMAHEVLSDLALYDGRLEECSHHAGELRRAAEAGGDTHLLVMALTNLALARAYAGTGDDAGEVLDQMGRLGGDLAPSDRAWCRYVAGEVAAEHDPGGAVEPLREAVLLGEEVGNRLVASVARTTLASSLHRAGDEGGALDEFATSLREALAQGNDTHATTTLRNVVGLLVDLGAHDDAGRLLHALEGTGTKGTFGAEAARLRTAAAAVGGGDGRARDAGGNSPGLTPVLQLALVAVDRLRAGHEGPHVDTVQAVP